MRKVVAALLFTFIGFSTQAIVIQQDTKANEHIINKVPSFLIDMPHEGHGALIAPQWIVTAQHVIFYDYQGKTLTIDGKDYTIEKVVKHEGFKTAPKHLTQGDASALMTFMKSTHDIALVKLSSPVQNRTPIDINRSFDEKGKIITAFGRGATGDGKTGAIFETKRTKTLRTMQNKFESAEKQWLSIRFDQGKSALPLEGIDGSGDSGGPLVIEHNGKAKLAGLFSWDYIEGNVESFTAGLFGNSSYQVRISYYADWIDQITNESTK